jgi:TolA-binding protein
MMMKKEKLFPFLVLCALALPFQLEAQEIDEEPLAEDSLEQSAEPEDVDSRLAALERRFNKLFGKLEEIDHKLTLIQKESAQIKAQEPSVNTAAPKKEQKVDAKDVDDDALDGEADPEFEKRGKERYISKKPEFDPEQDKVRDDKDSEEDTYLPVGTVEEDYEKAVGLLRDGNDKLAQKAFQYFLKQYPKNALALNAKYWLAETYFVQKNFKSASVHFAEAYQEYSKVIEKGKDKEKKKQAYAKAPEALAKLAFSLKNMGKKEDACVALEELSANFKQIAPNVKRLVAKARDGLTCK